MLNNDSKQFKNVMKIILYISIVVILFVGGLLTGKSLKLLSKISSIENNLNKDDLGINEDLINNSEELSNGKIITIAAFGLDRRTSDETPRSDAIMLITIDSSRKKVKLISIMRDLYVNIDGVGKDKLNHAYFYGGPSLSIKTLNNTFNLNIEDYISLDFFNLPKIIDELGGIELDVKSEEINNLNKYIKENQRLLGVSGDHTIKSSGFQTLSGIQALSYARIRSVGDGDFERTDRQRKVIIAMIDKAKTMSPIKLTSLVEKYIDSIETSLSLNKLLSIGANLLLGGYEIEQTRAPFEGEFNDSGKIINGVWYLTFDQEKTTESLHKYIFDDILP